MTKEPWGEELEELLAMIDEMEIQGKNEYEIIKFLKDLDLIAFEKATQFLLDGGLSKPEVKNFWKDMAFFGDEEEHDSIDTGDKQS